MQQVNDSLPAFEAPKNPIRGMYSDLEGPLVTADHAAALLKIFKLISVYDDIKFFVEKEPGYNPGDTLKLIAPLLHALDKDESFLRKKAEDLGTTYIRGAQELCQSVPIRIISTSYHQFVHYVTDEDHLNVPTENVYCTYFPLDELTISIRKGDKQYVLDFIDWLKNINNEDFSLGEDLEDKINNLESLDYRFELSFYDLPKKTRELYDKINEFYDNLLMTSYAQLLENVKPCGGIRKYEALVKALDKDNNTLENAFVVGDSITDCVMLDETRKAGGLAVSFNGNRYCLLSAEIAVFSENCYVTKALYELCLDEGKEAVLELAENWDRDFKKVLDTKEIKNEYPVMYNGLNYYPIVRRLTDDNRFKVIEEFENYRKVIRGKFFGSLG